MGAATRHARVRAGKESGVSAAAMSLAGTPVLCHQKAQTQVPRWPLVATAIVIGVTFFLSGHDLNISLAEAYTQDAEQMEIAAAGGNTLRRVTFLAVGAWGVMLLATSRQ